MINLSIKLFSLFVADALSKSKRVTTYSYVFEHAPNCTLEEVPADLVPKIMGAFHSSELPYVFHTRANRKCTKSPSENYLSVSNIRVFQREKQKSLETIFILLFRFEWLNIGVHLLAQVFLNQVYRAILVLGRPMVCRVSLCRWTHLVTLSSKHFVQ